MPGQNRDQNRAVRDAAIRSEPAGKKRNQLIAIAAGIVAVLAVIVTAGFWFSGGSGDPAASSSQTPKATVGQNSLIVGNKLDAKVKVVIYEDFLCPFCRQFETASRDYLHADAAEGKVLVEYRPFQLLGDDYSKRALNAWAAVLQRGTPAQALEFHDLLYDKQPYENAPDKPDNDALKALAQQAGVKSQSTLDAFDTENTDFYTAVERAAQDAEVQSTPTIVVNGRQLTGSSVDDMVSSLEKQIAGS